MRSYWMDAPDEPAQGIAALPGLRGAQGAQGATGFGATGMTGPSPGSRGSIGSRGSPGSKGNDALPGPQGPAGSQGPTGPAGTGFSGDFGTKLSVIPTINGNRGFSCFENARPRLLDVYHCHAAQVLPLRSAFFEACAHGSIFVLSIVPRERCRIGGRVVGDRIWLDCRQPIVRATVIVCGTHKDFVDWDMKQVPDADRERSRRFWKGEHANLD